MLFNSYIFLLLFLPIFITGYFLLGRFRNRNVLLFFIIAMSLIFYGYNHVRYVPLISGSIVVNYLVSLALRREDVIDKGRLKKGIMAAGLIFNIALIFYFKYYDFFITNINDAFHTECCATN